MPSFPSGLIVTPSLRAAQVTSLEFTFEPSVGVMARKIDKLKYGIKDMRQPLRAAIREVVIPSIRLNFHKSGRPRWAPLSEDTWAQKGTGEKALIRSGALMNTMGQIGIWHIDREKALLNQLPESVWYGALHQAGHGKMRTYTVKNVTTHQAVGTFQEAAGGTLPARPFVMLQPEDVTAIDAVFNRWLGLEIRKAGF